MFLWIRIYTSLRKNIEYLVVAVPEIMYIYIRFLRRRCYCKCMLNFATDNEFDVFVFPLLMLALNHIPQRACCHPPRDGGIDFEKGVRGGD